MSRSSVYLLVVAGLCLSSTAAYGQAVISTHAGVVHYFEGAVTVAGQPLEAHLGKFATIPEGAELRTEKGRAEILLTPGVFLRVGENSAIRMQANALSNTRVELLAGSAVVDSSEPDDGTSVTMIVQGWNVHQQEKGSYRIDYEPPRLQVTDGTAEASTGGTAPMKIAQGMELPLRHSAVAQPAAEPHDELNQWAEGRNEAITADNAVAANIQDPANLSTSGLPADAFTYYPMLPFPSYGTSTTTAGNYGTPAPYPYPASAGSPAIYQTGFYAFYLPGYSRRPLGSPLPILGLASGLNLVHFPARTGFPTTTLPTTTLQHVPLSRPMPVARPLPGMVPRPAAPVGARPGATARPATVHVIHR